MTNQSYHQSRFRLSLRELFLFVGFLAVAIVSLRYASTVWQIVAGLLVLIVFIGAIVEAIVDRGRRQAFAIGVVAAMVGYQGALIHSGIGRDFNTEFVSSRTRARLPTTMLLRSLFEFIVVRTDVFGEGARSGTIVDTTEWPSGSAFMFVGHCWWGLLLGYASGYFARFLYLRRTSEPESSKVP